MPVQFEPGQRIRHADFGEGVVIGTAHEGYLRAFFPDGERQVAARAVQSLVPWNERVLSCVEGGAERLRRAWLAREAHALPLMDGAAALTAAAMSNHDPDRFSLDDYRPLADVGAGFDRIVRFLDAALGEDGRRVQRIDERTFVIPSADGGSNQRFTTDREIARAQEGIELLGLDHPLVVGALKRWQALEPEMRGVAVDGDDGPAAVSWWLIHSMGENGQQHTFVRPLAVNRDGARMPELEREGPALLRRPPNGACFSSERRRQLLRDILEPILQRELRQHGLVPEGGSYRARLIGWAEVGADVTRRLNELFADPELRREQLQTAAELAAAGTDWGDERW